MNDLRRNVKRIKLTTGTYTESSESCTMRENRNFEDLDHEESDDDVIGQEEIEDTDDDDEYFAEPEDVNDHSNYSTVFEDSKLLTTGTGTNSHETVSALPTCFQSENDVDGLDFRLRCYINFVCQESLSNDSLDRLDNLMTVLYGIPPCFTKKDVIGVIGGIEKAIIRKTRYYCNLCGRQKNKKRERCKTCLVSSNNLLETVTFIECHVNYQLEKFLKNHGKEILRAHTKVRNGMESFASNDIRKYQGYRNHMEKEEEFRRNEVNLICSFSSDGAVFKRLSRREATPIFLNVEGADVSSKKNGKALCLIALSFSDGGIKKNLINESIQRVFDQLTKFKCTVSIDDEIYSFRIVIMSVICDMKEQAALTSLPNWHHVQGCSRCLTVGHKKAKGKVSYSSFYPSRRRTNDEMLVASQNKTLGFSCVKVPTIYHHVPPTLIDIDPFHIRGAGVCKQIVTEFLKPTQWKNAKIEQNRLNLLKKTIEDIVPYTSETIKTQSFKKLSKYTGRELDKLSVIISALVGVTGSCNCNDFNALFIGWYHCLELMGSALLPAPSLRILLNKLYQLHVQLEKDTLTIKWHNFYEHLLDHEEKYGHLHTTEIYEREHKSLMTSVHSQTTNCEKIIISRYATGKIMKESLLLSKSNFTEGTGDIISRSMKPEKEVSSERLKKETNFMGILELSEHHRKLISNLDEPSINSFMRRIHVTTEIGDFMENHSMNSTRISNTHLLKEEIINTNVSSVSSNYEPHTSAQLSPRLPLQAFGPTSSLVFNGSDGSAQNQQNQTFKDLEKSVRNYELDIYKAGQAVHNGYARSDPTVHLEVAAFVDKYAGKIHSSKLPPPEPILDPHYLYIMTHGYGVVSQLALAASHKRTPKTDAESMELGNITGALCNIASDTNFHYPNEDPFSGEKIEFRVEMPRKLNFPAHVVIKKLLFTFLGRSCLHPTDIQSVTWYLPEDAAVPRSQNPVPFPRSLYDNLQNLLLQFFRLDEDLLSRGTYDNESCKNLRCLQGLSDENARRSRYMALHKARATFLFTTFHYQFKSAMADLKRSTYIPPPMGQKYGVFKLKPHLKRQRISDDMIPEE